MAEKLNVEVTGRSLYEIAHQMATQILFSVENKQWGGFDRKEYLRAHYQAMRVLTGYNPD